MSFAKNQFARSRESKMFVLREFKELDGGAQYKFSGYLSVFNNVDQGDDRVIKGAFTKTLQDLEAKSRAHDKPFLFPLLWNHDADLPLGGCYFAKEDDHGLYTEWQIDPNVQRAREVYSGLKMGYIPGLSIGYDAIRARHNKGVRELLELRLWEGSAVTFPMNDEALVPVSSVKKAGSGAGAMRKKLGKARRVPRTIQEAKALEFSAALNSEQNDYQEQWHNAFQALFRTLMSIMYDSSVTDKGAAIGDAVDEFNDVITKLGDESAAANFYPASDDDYDSFADPDDDQESGYMSAGAPDEAKAGRAMSATNHEKMGGLVTDAMTAHKAMQKSLTAISDFHKALDPNALKKPVGKEPTDDDSMDQAAGDGKKPKAEAKSLEDVSALIASMKPGATK